MSCLPALAAAILALPIALGQLGQPRSAAAATTTGVGPFSSINAVSMPSSSEAWAVAPGAILHSADGGATWQLENAPAGDPDLTDVSFPDQSNGWAVAGNSVYRTSDGGQTWAVSALPASASALRIHFADATHGWAIGSGELRTTDAGQTWTSVTVPPPYNGLDAVSFVDALNGWGVSSNAVLVTHDGGITWSAQLPAPTNNDSFVAVAFADSSHGWALDVRSGSPGEPILFATSDGGGTWTQQTVPSGTVAYRDTAGLFAISDTTALIGSTTGYLARTDDGGANWSSVTSPAGGITGFAGSATGLLAVGTGSCQDPAALSSSDAGMTWQEELPQLPYVEYTNGISFPDSQHGVATNGQSCGALGVVDTTADGGATWREVAQESLYDPAFASPQVGWALGAMGTRVSATADAGGTWTAGTLPAGFSADDLAAVAGDPQDVWASGCYPAGTATCNAAIAHSADGGSSWQLEPMPADLSASTVLVTVHFVDALHGWAGGMDSTNGVALMLGTTDGGATWTSEAVPNSSATSCKNYKIYGIAATDAAHAWAVGFGSILATTDGGKTWICPVAGGGNIEAGSVSFADAAHGWLVRVLTTSYVDTTDDGGSTWSDQSLSQFAGATRAAQVEATDLNHVFVGAEDAVLASSDGGNTWSEVAFPVHTETQLWMPASALEGQPATFTADVRDLIWLPTPTGSVTFSDGGTPIGTVPVDASGHAVFTTTRLSAGSHSITASYQPAGAPYLASASPPVTLSIATAQMGGTWTREPGLADDLAAGGGHVFALGTNPEKGGYGLWEWTNNSWQPFSGAGTSLAVDSAGHPWVTNSLAEIWHWTGSAWERVDGAAHYVAAGQDGSVYVLGTDATEGGWQIWQRTDTGWSLQSGGLVDMSVGVDGSLWGVNDGHLIYRRPAGATWSQLPGGANDVSAFDQNTAWVVGSTQSTAGGDGLWFWDGSNWTETGAGSDVAVDSSSGYPWVVNSSGEIYLRG